MSGYLSGMIWKSDLPKDPKYILLAMADHGKDDGSDVYPSVKHIALKTGLSERTVQRHIKKFVAGGVLEIVAKATHHSPVKYRICVGQLYAIPGLETETLRLRRGDTGDTSAGVTGVTPVTVRGDTGDGPGVTPVTVRGDTGDGLYKVLNVIESSLESLSNGNEREILMKDLKRIFPSIQSIPASIPTHRAFLFWYRVRTGEIQPGKIFSPIAYLMKMADEDISLLFAKDGERISRMLTAAGKGVR